MSDQQAKAERSAAKDKRQGIEELKEKPVGSRTSKAKKPFLAEYWSSGQWWDNKTGWRTFGRYKTENAAKQAIENVMRSGYGWYKDIEQFRINGAPFISENYVYNKAEGRYNPR